MKDANLNITFENKNEKLKIEKQKNRRRYFVKNKLEDLIMIHDLLLLFLILTVES